MCQKADLVAPQQYHFLRTEASGIFDYEKTEKILNAVASKSRLQILECIQKGDSNPGEIAKALSRHRSTVEKHLRVLLKAKIIEKVPSLSKGGHLEIRYRIQENANMLLTAVQDAVRRF